MRSFLPICGGCLVLAAASLPPWTAAQETPQQPTQDAATQGPAFASDIRPLVQKYCFECHSTQKKKAGLDLEAIATDSSPANWPEVWDQVGERLRAREMPPAKSPQPTEVERVKLLAWVTHVAQVQVSCDKLTPEQLEKSTAGYTMSRRLNRTEYNNTLRDLFGVDLHAGDLLPVGRRRRRRLRQHRGHAVHHAGAHGEIPGSRRVGPGHSVFANPSNGCHQDAKKLDRLQVKAARRTSCSASFPAQGLEPHDAARKVLASLLPRAFRRPVTAEEVERYLGIFDKATKRGDSFEQCPQTGRSKAC